MEDRVRDPAVWRFSPSRTALAESGDSGGDGGGVARASPPPHTATELTLFFTHFRGNPRRLFAGETAPYTVRAVRTRDWRHFSDAEDVTPQGYASPDGAVEWHQHTLFAFQAYPDKVLGGPKSGLYYSTLKKHFVNSSKSDGSPASRWTTPKPFLKEALSLEWNSARRAIDPTFVVHNDTLHCFFVGSDGDAQPRKQKHGKRRINMLGHAISTDPELKKWTVLTKEKPLLGVSERAPDGVENVAIFRRNSSSFVMIYSEGLAQQHLAIAISSDLRDWTQLGKLEIEIEPWSSARFGAPFVWAEAGCFFMLLMGESEQETHASAFGLFSSTDGISNWRPVRS